MIYVYVCLWVFSLAPEKTMIWYKNPSLRIGVASTGTWNCWQVYVREPQKNGHLRKSGVLIICFHEFEGTTIQEPLQFSERMPQLENARRLRKRHSNKSGRIATQTYKTTNFIAKLCQACAPYRKSFQLALFSPYSPIYFQRFGRITTLYTLHKHVISILHT